MFEVRKLLHAAAFEHFLVLANLLPILGNTVEDARSGSELK
jgi:hypothetical protein